MKRLQFDSKGRLVAVDDAKLESYSFPNRKDNGYSDESDEDDEGLDEGKHKLITSNSLEFLKDYGIERSEGEKEYWSLFSNGKKLEPLKFTNNKSQEDIVKEVVGLIEEGNKVVFIHGVCGTGKSAIALNIARALGRASIVVPVKSLQRQYEEDYMGKKYVLKDGKKLKIAMITGRDNHDSIIKPGISCADPFLPETIKITEKNYGQIAEYYEQNPLIKHKVDTLDTKTMKRISIAPANPYWSPIASKEIELHLPDAKKKKYKGLNGKDFVFYHRKQGCSYYDQYQAYLDADVIIFNSTKYKIETALDRKPATEVEIIDEADEFLDSFSTQEELNITRLISALSGIVPDDPDAKTDVDEIIELLKLEEKNKHAVGVDENKIFHINETKLNKVIGMLLKNPEIEVEASLDEMNYSNKAIEVAKEFKEFLEDTYLTFKRKDNDLVAHLVTTNLSKKFGEIIEKNKAIVLMSGTLHSESVLKNVFGIKEYSIVEAETYNQGTIEIHMTGKEIDCKYSNFSSKKHSREDYLKALSAAMQKAKKPVLVHVNSFEDLPTMEERDKLDLAGVMAREKLFEMQTNDKTGKMISMFKSKMSDSLFTTKCSRGVDFPGDTCNSVVFTKYPNPNVRGTFWKILEKTHSKYYWGFYRDKARREFLQRIYRAVRSKTDHVYVLSPDSRVLDAVRDLQIVSKKN